MFFYLAPIQGITDSSFRNIYCSSFAGIDCCMAPFVSAVAEEKVSRKLFKDILPENNTGNRVIPQILGNSAPAIIGTANAMKELGYEEANLNLGCPYPMVTKKNRGAGLLRDTDNLDRLLDDIFTKINIRLSIKTRIGFENSSEILKLIEIYNRYPMSELIIHPRVASQMYSGRASIDAFIKVVELSGQKLVYNGDICGRSFFNDLKIKIPDIDRWMIGRAAISNPFLPEMILNNSPVPENAQKRFFRFHDELYKAYSEKFHGPAHLLDKMKGLWRYFCISIKTGSDICKKINKLKNVTQYIETLEDLKGSGIDFIELSSPLHLK